MSGLSPERLLDTSAVYTLYQGGLAFDSERQRLRACYVVLLAGRLGLRPDEIRHAHEGWVDWERGELRIPDHDSCACRTCVARAREAQGRRGSQSLGDLLAQEFWSPRTEQGARTVPFGWSDRLTAVLASFFADRSYLDCTPTQMQTLVAKAAANTDGLDPEGVDLGALRASGASFLADVGFEPAHLADLLGVDVDEAAPFTRREGGHARDILYRAVDSHPPDVCGENSDYPLVCRSAAFDREPFDPEAASNHREQLAQQDAGRRLRNPRPDATPDGVSYEPPDSIVPDHVAESAVERDDRGPVAVTLDSFGPQEGRSTTATPRKEAASSGTTTTDSAQAGGTATKSTGEGGSTTGSTVPGETVLDPRELATDPVTADFSTTLACADVESGKPVSGRVILGQGEVVLSHDDGADYNDVPLSSVTDVALDYTPSDLAEAFESALGVAYQKNGTRRLFVLELPGKKQLDFSIQLFKLLLDDTPVVVTHPARKGGRVTDESPEQTTQYVRSRKMEFGPDEEKRAFGIRLSDIVHVERGKQTFEGASHKGLSVRHLRPDGQAVTTDIAPRDEDDLKLLERYVMRNYRERKERAKKLDLSADQKEVLVALYSTGGGMDITMILDKDSDELSTLLASLKEAGLVRTSGDGAKLTGMGQMIVSDKVDDVNV